MKVVFDNIDRSIVCTDAFGPGWLNLERYSYWTKASMGRSTMRERQGDTLLKWNKVQVRRKDCMAHSKNFFGRIIPWWVTGLSKTQVENHIAHYSKRLPNSGALYVFWCSEGAGIVAPNRTRAEIFSVALAWSPDPDVEGINSVPSPWDGLR